MVNNNKQKEYRSGDVRVSAYDDYNWYIAVVPDKSVVPDKEGKCSRTLFPNGQLLADFINAQQPKPRYYVEESFVVDRLLDERMGNIYNERDAQRIARLLNADEEQ